MHGHVFMTEQVDQQRVRSREMLVSVPVSRRHTEARCICRPRIQLSHARYHCCTLNMCKATSSSAPLKLRWCTRNRLADCSKEGRVGIQSQRTRHVCHTDEDILSIVKVKLVRCKEGVDPEKDDSQDLLDTDYATWADVHRIDPFSKFSFSTIPRGRLALIQ